MNPRMTDVVLPQTFEQTASFTPGKWEFREIYPYDDGLGYISADGRDIIHAGVSDLAAEENRANARLIAAAPDLLTTLKGVVPAWERLYPSFPLNRAIEDAEFAEFLAARTAIAAAEGGEA